MSTEIRFWRPEDLPTLRRFTATNAWELMPADDRQGADPNTVATAALHHLEDALSSPGGTALVAADGGRPVGYCLVILQEDEKTGEPMGYLADCYVEPAYRKVGIAPAFHRLTQEYLSALGIRKSRLWVHAHNPHGAKSAHRAGFAVRGLMMAKTLQ